MYVIGIGAVSEVNDKWIHLNNEGKQERIAANAERLEAIRAKAAEDVSFYERMYQELHTMYEERLEYAKAHYKAISDEDIEAEYKANGRSKKWFDMSLMKDSNNEECRYQFGKVFGISEAASGCTDKQYHARRLLKQATEALKVHGKGTQYVDTSNFKKVLRRA